MLVIGLTGGIATGKSTVAAILRQQGVSVLDCDEIAHAVVRKVRSLPHNYFRVGVVLLARRSQLGSMGLQTRAKVLWPECPAAKRGDRPR